MARTEVVSQPVVRTGLNPTLTAPVADGDVIDSGDVILWVDNGSGAELTVTVQTPVTYDGLELEDLVVAIPAGNVRMIGPFPARTFAQPRDATEGAGRVLVDYAGDVTTVLRGVISI